MPQSQRVMIVDDEPGVRTWLASLVQGLGHEVTLAASGEEAIRRQEAQPHDLVTLDIGLPGMDGLDTLRALRRLDPGVRVIMVSGAGPTQTIVEAIREGASDFLRKPFEPDDLARAFENALSRASGRSGARTQRAPIGDPTARANSAFVCLGRTRRMLRVEETITHVADTDITVLIRGESGTGKELVARTLYRRSSRRDRPLVKVNCAALPAELLESELFGYEKGAFTGAQRRKLGKFEAASGGTIFLDEISEMHPGLQAKLLQVLQDGQFARLGGERDIEVDTRVIAATNRDLEASVRAGAFREDLFYRLNVVTVHIPPLRERPDEIHALTVHFLRTYAQEYGKDRPVLSAALRDALRDHDWPGNVRELENLIKRLVVLGDEQPVLKELRAKRPSRLSRPDLPGAELQRFLAGETESVNLKRIAREATLVAEKHQIERVLERTRWNRKQAAQILKISYKALLYKMKDAGLARSA